MKNFWLMLWLILILCGCHSDQYYHNEAVERARSFLLENCRDLSSEQINFVRFNTPVLLHAPVLNKKEFAEDIKIPVTLHQICVTWIIPGKKDLYMVFGVSSGRMSDWYPSRVILKKSSVSSSSLPDAAKMCIAYARNNFFEQMDVSESNMVRYTAPYLYSTNFELNLDPQGKMSSEEFDKAKVRAGGKKQYSIVWKMPRRNLVFAGLAGAKLSNWNIYMAGFMDDAELSQHTVTELMTPDDFYKPFPEAKELPAAEKKQEK